MLARRNGSIAGRARNSFLNCEIDYIPENLFFRIVNTEIMGDSALFSHYSHNRDIRGNVPQSGRVIDY